MAGVKGRSGRKPNKPYLTPALRALLGKRDPETGEMNRARLVQALFDAALAGDVQALKYIFDRIDGKVPDTVDVGSDPERPIRFTFTFDRADDDDDAEGR